MIRLGLASHNGANPITLSQTQLRDIKCGGNLFPWLVSMDRIILITAIFTQILQGIMQSCNEVCLFKHNLSRWAEFQLSFIFSM